MKQRTLDGIPTYPRFVGLELMWHNVGRLGETADLLNDYLAYRSRFSRIIFRNLAMCFLHGNCVRTVAKRTFLYERTSTGSLCQRGISHSSSSGAQSNT